MGSAVAVQLFEARSAIPIAVFILLAQESTVESFTTTSNQDSQAELKKYLILPLID